MKHPLFVFLFLIIALNFAKAQIPPSPGKYTAVLDLALILKGNDEDKITKLLKAYFDSTSNQIVVLTVESLEGLKLEDYAQAVFKNWGIGNKDSNNGLLLLVAKKERKIKIEVGYGFEEILPDAFCARVVDEYILPYFKEERYYRGLMSGLEVILQKLNGADVKFEKSISNSFSDKKNLSNIRDILFVVIIISFIAILLNAVFSGSLGFSLLVLFFWGFKLFFILAFFVGLPAIIITYITGLFIEGLRGSLLADVILMSLILINSFILRLFFWKYIMKLLESDSGSSGSSTSTYSSYRDSSSSYRDYSDYSDSFGGGSSGGGGASGSW
jgi:uncharacterized protein